MNTNFYAVDQGRYGAAQVNYFTKSGGNQLRGDVYEVWNGSLLNAQNYFLHANDSPGNIAKKPRSTVNEFGVSVSGPILPQKLFFFAHYEGIRIALPLVLQVTAPSPAYQQYVLQQLATGGVDPITGVTLPAQPAEIPLYRSMFGLYSNTSGTPVPVSTCPIGSNGAMLPAPAAGALLNGDGCANQRQASLNNKDSEDLVVLKSIIRSMRGTASGSGFSRTPACRLLTPTRSTPSLTLSRPSPSARLSSDTHTCSRRIS